MIKEWYKFGSLFACIALAITPAYAKTGNGFYRHAQLPSERIAELRTRGPDGLAEALATYDALQQDYARVQQVIFDLDREVNEAAAAQAEGAALVAKQTRLKEARGELININWQLEKWRKAIDQIGGQRTCLVSRLYWHTDLGKAQQEAARTGRPIFSLRMLGKLTDEYSCANSRFFRTSLYSNKEISNYLRANYVLHWHSVRPAPRVTIDFGDGRKLERTLTGNSAHYVLASDGQPLDALPGLYSPKEFQAWLARMNSLFESYREVTASNRGDLLRSFHSGRNDAIMQAWDADIERLGIEQSRLVMARMSSLSQSEKVPTAAKASNRAVVKSVEVAPLMRFAKFGGESLQRSMDDELWQAIANLHREEVQLDEPSQAVMREEFPRAAQAGQVSVSKREQENPVLKMVRLFEDSLALDTVRNEYLLHRRIHERFAEGQPESVDALNEWVYAELFLTPSSDPWLGLAPQDIYTALDNGGMLQ